ncbi:MAG: hypothetical protein NTY75_00305 [Candidatus Shapirobacteria bacterium]|nr:hypothetical protein [Candidatus Shapirobacteria bacterium]
MKEQYPHVEMMCKMLGLPFESEIEVRQTKEKIMKNVGISNGTNAPSRETFIVNGDETESSRLLQYIYSETSQDKYLSILVMRQKWGNSGGCPVVYVSNQDDINKKLEVKDGKLTGLITQSGEHVIVKEESHINTYSRKRSRVAILGGFDNYKDKREVRMGGGFRLQVDGLSVEEDSLSLLLSGIFSFDDRGSRILSLDSQQDLVVPRYSDNYCLRFEDRLLSLSTEKGLTADQVVDTQSAKEACLLIMENLFNRDRSAITRLLRLLFSTSPSLKLHQLEGMHSVLENQVSPEIIDFDGIDGLDSARSLSGESLLPDLSATERLVRAQLCMGGFLYADPIELRKLITN